MSSPVSFEQYLSSLGTLTAHVDPTQATPESEDIRDAERSLRGLASIDQLSLADWIGAHPHWTPVLGLVVGLGQEKLKNALKDRFDTSGWISLAQERPHELASWLDSAYDLVDSLQSQLNRRYRLADILIARAGTRATATRAGNSGRKVEDEIEAIISDLGLPYKTRTRFEGRNQRTAPCDLVVPDGRHAEIVVAAKGFDSTGSKLTDAVREIEEMADVRLPRQFVTVVVDGIGWKSRKADLRRIHGLWMNRQIDGMYTLATLDRLREDIADAARLRKLI